MTNTFIDDNTIRLLHMPIYINNLYEKKKKMNNPIINQQRLLPFYMYIKKKFPRKIRNI